MAKMVMMCILAAGTYDAAFSLIVWNGEIVGHWPDQGLPFMRKATAASSASGFFTRPVGQLHCLTVIIDFSDQPAQFTKEQVEDWLNKPGFNAGSIKGSVRDYFYECSNGRLELVNDVAGYYRAKKTKSYYENLSMYTGSEELVEEAMNHIDSTVDFSTYDNDGNGATESVNFVYAGKGKTFGQGLWPHAGNYGKKRDGVLIGRYNMSDMGDKLTLYVFCHETGHMLFGWPDLYWFGDYCIMGNRMSETNPQAINDFFRADQEWIPTTRVAAADNKAFSARHNGGGFSYVNPSEPRELFYWSVVNDTGRWSNVKGRGVLVYHFDKRLGGNSSADRRALFVVEADGNNKLASSQWPDPGDEASDFFNAGTKSEFSAKTTPASSWGLKIYDISAAADTMTFKVGTGPVAVVPLVKRSCPAQGPKRDVFTHYDLLGRVCGFGSSATAGGGHFAAGCYVSWGDNRLIVP